MGTVKFEVPDGRWFGGDYQHKPEDKSFCVIMISDHMLPEIGLYKEKFDQFLRVSFIAFNRGVCHSNYIDRKDVKRWKLLDLPTEIEERLLSTIEEWKV